MNNVIKEVKLSWDMQDYNNNILKEKIRISSNWISYKRITNNAEESWDYKDNSDGFVKKYKLLSESCLSLTDEEDSKDLILVEIKDFNNNEKQYHLPKNDIPYDDFESKDFIKCVIEMIPNGYRKPACLLSPKVEDLDIVYIENTLIGVEKLIEQEKNGEEVYYPSKFLFDLVEKIGPDYRYDKHYTKAYLNGLKKQELTYEELRTIITQASRQVHFGAATVKDFIESGQLIRWLDNLIKLINESKKGNKTNISFEKKEFTRKVLTKEVLDNIDPNNIVAFMYAGSGAMGSPGEIELVDDNLVVFTNNLGIINGNYDEPFSIEQFNLDLLFKDFKHIDDPVIDYKKVLLNGDDWVYIDLDMNNWLYLRNDCYNFFKRAIVDINKSVRYVNWGTLTQRM